MDRARSSPSFTANQMWSNMIFPDDRYCLLSPVDLLPRFVPISLCDLLQLIKRLRDIDLGFKVRLALIATRKIVREQDNAIAHVADLALSPIRELDSSRRSLTF